jgi:hypothetical protein
LFLLLFNRKDMFSIPLHLFIFPNLLPLALLLLLLCFPVNAFLLCWWVDDMRFLCVMCVNDDAQWCYVRWWWWWWWWWWWYTVMKTEIVWVENFKTVKYYVRWWWWWWYTVMKNWNGLGRKLETVKYLYT